MPNTRPNMRLNLPANSSSRRATTTPFEAARRRPAAGRTSNALKPGMFIMKMPSSAKPRSTSSAAMRSAAGKRRLGAGGAGRFGVGHGADGTQTPRAARRRRVATKGIVRCSNRHRRQPAQALVAGRDREALAASGRPSGAELEQAKADATLLWLKAQEDAGLDIVGDGEQSRQHFVHGFLAQVEGIDFEHKVKMGIRDNRYDAMVPQVVGAAAPRRPRPRGRGAPGARPHRQASSSSRCPGR